MEPDRTQDGAANQRRQAIARLISGLTAAGRKVDESAVIAAHPELMPELEAALRKLSRMGAGETASVILETVVPPAGASHIGYAIAADQPPVQVKGYSIQRELGRGGQAVVYLATQENTGRRVALKIMRPEALADERALARFKREVQVLAALEHPNIVGILDTGVTSSGGQFIAMNYVAGVTLDEYMKSRQRSDSPDPAKLLRLFLKICAAVNVAHVRGIVHRDLKPGNIRIDERGEPHILDFGLAHTPLDRLMGGEHPIAVTGEFLGSLPWCSPEQAEGDPDRIDMRTDVYSLGVILYQFLTDGKFPYEVVGNIRNVLNNILNTEPMPPSKVVPARQSAQERRPGKLGPPPVNPVIESIVLRALSKNRELRYQSAGELGRDVAHYLAGQQTAERQKEAPAAARAATPRARKFAVIGLAVMALCAVGAAAWLMTRKSSLHSGVTIAPAAQVIAAAPTAVPRMPVAIAATPHSAGMPDNQITSVIAGTAHLEGDALALTPGNLPATVYFGPTDLSDYDMSFDAMTNENGDGKGFRVIIHNAMRNACLYWLGAEDNTLIGLYSRFEGNLTRLQWQPYRLEPDQWYNVKVQVRGAEIQCFLDGQERLGGREERITRGRAGLSSSDITTRFRNIKLTAPDGSVIWQGPPDLSHLAPQEIDPSDQISAPMVRKTDLLKSFGASSDVLLGSWNAGSDGLTGRGTSAQIQFHIPLPEEYVFRVRFVRFGGNKPIALIASRDGRPFAFVLGGHEGTLCGFGVIDGRNYDDNETTRHSPRWITNGIVHTLVVRVRKQFALAYLDGMQHDRVNVELSSLALPAECRRDRSPPLGVWLGGDQVTIQSAELLDLVPALPPATMPATMAPSESEKLNQ
ncbi:MAG: protein kinase [Tepidisphaeraceae bacterium]|jgi:tRNA A-37 threonylcarbamoyl transferase component Bud32